MGFQAIWIPYRLHLLVYVFVSPSSRRPPKSSNSLYTDPDATYAPLSGYALHFMRVANLRYMWITLKCSRTVSISGAEGKTSPLALLCDLIASKVGGFIVKKDGRSLFDKTRWPTPRTLARTLAHATNALHRSDSLSLKGEEREVW